MIFNKKIQAIKIPFNWAAEYYDGNYLTEYDLSNHKENSFYSIDQNSTMRFGLIGQGMSLFFEKYSGVFNLNGYRLDVLYRVGDKDYYLTNTNSKKDLITYKEAFTDVDLNGNYHQTTLHSINFGYKTNIQYDDLIIYFQPIVSLPFNKSAELKIKMTSNKDIDGELIFMRQNKEIERFDAPLSKNESGHINWIIK